MKMCHSGTEHEKRHKLADLFFFLGNLTTEYSTSLGIPQTFSNGPINIAVAWCCEINCLFYHTTCTVYTITQQDIRSPI